MDKENLHECGCNNDEGCGCGGDHEHSHDGCGCGGHEHSHEGCGCGCGEEGPAYIELEDENGNVVRCDVVDAFEYKDNEYILVQNPEEDSVYLFKVEGEDENAEFVVPEDDEFEEVTAYYQSISE